MKDIIPIPNVNAVELFCSCGKASPISREYFCRHCLKIRCATCMSHEVDCYYCPGCLENVTTNEVRMNKERCKTCYECPSCGVTLSNRATIVHVANPDDPAGKPLSQKVFYMVCAFCRWSTRDALIPDQKSSNAAWPTLENKANRERIKELNKSFEALATLEKTEKESTKYTKKKSYLLMMEPTASVNWLNRRSSAAALKLNKAFGGGKDSSNVAAQKTASNMKLPAAEALEFEATAADEDFFDVEAEMARPFELEKLNRLDERHRAAAVQPNQVASLRPLHKLLAAKRSMRCRECDHNLCKPEVNPNHIKFKIHLSALFHVPDIRIRGPSSSSSLSVSSSSNSSSNISASLFKPGQRERITLCAINPAARVTTLRFLNDHADDGNGLDGDKDGGDSQSKSAANQTANQAVKVKIELPSTPIRVDPKSEMIADFDDATSPSSSAALSGATAGSAALPDDPEVISGRSGNRVYFYAYVTAPQTASGREGEAASEEAELYAAFSLTFDWKDMTAAYTSSYRKDAAAAAAKSQSGAAGDAASETTEKSQSGAAAAEETHISQITVRYRLNLACLLRPN